MHVTLLTKTKTDFQPRKYCTHTEEMTVLPLTSGVTVFPIFYLGCAAPCQSVLSCPFLFSSPLLSITLAQAGGAQIIPI